MLKLISNSVLASEIAEYLNKPLIGKDVVIYRPGILDSLNNNSITFFEKIEDIEKVDFDICDEVLILSSIELDKNDKYSFIKVEKPKIELIRIVEKFFTIPIEHSIHKDALIEEGAQLGKNIYLSAGCFIGADVIIGDNSIIWENTVIKGKAIIGSNCIIKSNATIGSDIFHFMLDGDNWLQFPQIGKIIIEDNVWIGANTTIEKGTLGNTIIKRGARIDDLVQIGSNCIIEENTIISAGSIISRDVKIGKRCWIAPNVSIRDNILINDEIVVGIGSVVVKDLLEKSIFVGNPANELKKRSS